MLEFALCVLCRVLVVALQLPFPQESLRAVSNLLYLRCYRDRIVDGMFRHTEFRSLMEKWPAGQLIHWRWSSLVSVCESLLEREIALRGNWSLSCLQHEQPRADQPDDDEPNKRHKLLDTKVFSACDEAVKSPWFWAFTRMLFLLHSQLDSISRWCEAKQGFVLTWILISFSFVLLVTFAFRLGPFGLDSVCFRSFGRSGLPMPQLQEQELPDEGPTRSSVC